MTKRLTLLLFLIAFAFKPTYGQNLSGKELFELLESDIGTVQKKLSGKGWTYKDATEGDASHFKVVTWAFNLTPNGAEQYFIMNIRTKQMDSFNSTNCLYSFTDKATYNKLINQVKTMGFKEGRTHINGRSLIETFAIENKFGLRIKIYTDDGGVTTYNCEILKYDLYIWRESRLIIEEGKNK